ncbi:MAG: hypothetical protein LBP76_06510 [Treponema sp.]|nr:hypothetical protein [Treponema sp.]
MASVSLNNNVSGATGNIAYKSKRGSGLTITANNQATTGNITITEATGNLTVGTGGITTEGNNTTSLGLTATAGAITVSETITGSGTAVNTGGEASLTSADNQNITISQAISGFARLVLKAGTGGVAINASITVTGTASGEGDTGAAIYIWADAITGTGPTETGAGGNTDIWYDTAPDATYLSHIDTDDDRTYHLHPRSNRHIVYMKGADPNLITVSDAMLSSGSDDYYYFQSDSALGTNITLYSGSGKNIYIVDVGDNTYSNTRTIGFAINGSGFIEIKGAYQSSGALTLNPGTGGVKLADGETSDPANITLTGNGFSTGGTKLTLLGDDASITAAGIILGGTVDGTTAGANHLLLDVSGAPNNTISVTGPVGGTTRLGDIEVRSTNSAISPVHGVTFTGAVTAKSYTQTGAGGTGSTLFSNAQDYSGVNASGNGFQFTGSALTLNAGLTTSATANSGAGGKVVIANTGAFSANSSGTINAGGAFSQTGAGTNSLAAGITTTNGTSTNASISFATKITLVGNVTLDSHAGNGTITLVSVDNTAAGYFGLNSGDGLITVNGSVAVDGTVTQTGASATTKLFGDVTTNNQAISFAGPVELNSDITISSGIGPGDISLGEAVSGTGKNLEFTAGTGSITVSKAVGGTGTDRLGALTITSAANANFSSATTPAAIYAASFTQQGGTGATAFYGTQDYTAGFTFTGAALTVDNTLTTNSDNSGDDGGISITSNGTINFATAATVIATSFNQTGSGTTTFDGSQNYTGVFTFTGTNLTVNNTLDAAGDIAIPSATDVTFASAAAVTAASFTQSVGTGTTTFNGPQTYTGAFTFTGTNLTVNNTLDAAGDIAIPSATDVTFASTAAVTAASFIQSVGTGTTTFNGPQTYTGAFSFIGNDLKINDNLITNGAISVTPTGTFTVGAPAPTASPPLNGGHINPGGSNGILTVTGTTVNDGTITAAPITSWNDAITFNGDYTSSGSLVGNSNENPNIIFKGNVKLTGASPIVPNGDWFVFSKLGGSNAKQTLKTVDSVTFGNVLINRTGSSTDIDDYIVEVVANSGTVTITQKDDSTLKIESGILDLTNNTWVVGDTAPLPSLNQKFIGYKGKLEFHSEKTELIVRGEMVLGGGATNDFIVNVDTTFSEQMNTDGFEQLLEKVRDTTSSITSVVEQLPRLTVVTGNVTIKSGTVFTSNTKNMFLNIQATTTTNALTVDSSVTIGGLAISDYDLKEGYPTSRVSGTLTLTSGLKLHGNVFIGQQKTLVADAVTTASGSEILPHPSSTTVDYTNKIEVGGSWVNERKGPTSTENGKFDFNESWVRFTGDNIYIIGTTQWYFFDCTIDSNPSAKAKNILFSSRGEPALSGTDPPYSNLTNSNNLDTHTFEKAFRVNGYKNPFDDFTPTKVRLVTINRWPNPRESHILATDSYLQPDTNKDPTEIKEADNDLHRNKFWDFVLQPGARMDLNYASVYYSYAVGRRIPIPWTAETAEVERRVFASPYSEGQGKPPIDPPVGWRWDSHFNFNWIFWDKFFYSYTEDSNGNGRIDRIRIQSAFELIAGEKAFEDFEIEVKGYEVDTSKGIGGYIRAPYQWESLYVYLKEKDYSDTGAILEWEVKRNTSLFENVTGSVIIGTPGTEKGKTIDTVPPRINYALTLPAHNQIFVQFSEPVDSALFKVDGSSTSVSPTSRLNDWEYLLPITTPFTVEDLAEGTKTFRVEKAVDRAVRAQDVNILDPDNPQYPSPSYPSDWSYTHYVTVRNEETPNGVFVQKHKLIDKKALQYTIYPYLPQYITSSPIYKPNDAAIRYRLASQTFPVDTYSLPDSIDHRVTDILVSQPPVHAADPTWFIWPVWAKDNPTVTTTNSDQFASFGLDDFPSTGLDDFGLIWEFVGKGMTGKNILQHRDITMQVRRHSTLTHTSNKPLLYYMNVADKDKATEKHGPKELWLPPFSMLNFSNIVPSSLPAYTSTAEKIANDIFNFTMKKDNYENRKMLEFVFKMDESSNTGADDLPLYAARLDIAKGAPVPANWYRLIKPFRIDIHDTIQQRSGVTILNNVIDPTKGEKTYLNYKTTRNGRVTIQVFTMDGTLVKVLRRESRNAGEYRETWDGKNRGGRAVARGMYFIRVVAPDIDEIRKVLVVK